MLKIFTDDETLIRLLDFMGFLAASSTVFMLMAMMFGIHAPSTRSMIDGTLGCGIIGGLWAITMLLRRLP